MRHFSDAYAALRRKNRGQYALLAGCSFFSVLLITAYVCMMRSPLSLIHICRCRRLVECRSRWSPYH